MQKIVLVLHRALAALAFSSCAGDDSRMEILSPVLLPGGYTVKQSAADGCFLVEDLIAADEESLLSGRTSWKQFYQRYFIEKFWSSSLRTAPGLFIESSAKTGVPSP